MIDLGLELQHWLYVEDFGRIFQTVSTYHKCVLHCAFQVPRIKHRLMRNIGVRHSGNSVGRHLYSEFQTC